MLLDPSEALHQRGLADAVDADEPDPLPGGDTERNVAELEALTVVRLAQAFAVDEARASAHGSGDRGGAAGGGGRAAGVRVVARTQRRSSGHPAGSDVQRQQQRGEDEALHWTALTTILAKACEGGGPADGAHLLETPRVCLRGTRSVLSAAGSAPLHSLTTRQQTVARRRSPTERREIDKEATERLGSTWHAPLIHSSAQ